MKQLHHAVATGVIFPARGDIDITRRVLPVDFDSRETSVAMPRGSDASRDRGQVRDGVASPFDGNATSSVVR
jgi:hypothetical protein